jgi:hypothetical protein
MPITHKFFQKNFLNGFQTNNAILDITPYKPEVMIIGTFNPDTPNGNADFFYGRNYFWPALKNLFILNGIVLLRRRIPQRGNLPAILNPTLFEIFELCKNLKLTFSDLIFETLHNNNPAYQLLQNGHIIFNNQEFNLIQDEQNGVIGGLQELDAIGQVHWNTQNIINYLCANPQIKQIYFTRRPTGIWNLHWNAIVNHHCMVGRRLTNIFTPSGMPLKGKPRMSALLNHWIYNIDPNFGNLDNNWLIDNGVEIENFPPI